MEEEKQSEINKIVNGKDIELLKLNYNALHESIWNNHKIAWTVTSIFIPVVFALQGFLINNYVFTISQIVAVFVTGFFLMSIWLLIMRILAHYNDARLKRLKEIEDLFDKELSNRIRDFFKDGRGFNLYNLEFKEKPKELKFSPMRIYYMIFGLYILLNIILLGALFLSA
ncbi:MAG: hypothetical protein H3Z50_05955 [archaeon]|nr:hypothetical protein [archaeon]